MCKYRNDGNKCFRRIHAFTLIELLVVVVIIGVLAGLLFSGVKASLKAVNQVKNTSNLKQIGTAVLAYAVDHQNTIPYNDGKVPSIGANTSAGSPPPKLFSSDWSFGTGTADYLTSPDVLYSPFASGMKGRPRGSLFVATTGQNQIGYYFYYQPRSGSPQLKGFYNDRLTENSRAPLYSDLDARVPAYQFTSDKCTFLKIDGSVRIYTQKEIFGLPSWTQRFQYIVDHP